MYSLLTGHTLFHIGRGFIGVILAVYLLQQGISLETIAVAKSLQLVASVLFNYPAGKIADRFGKKTAILTACFFSILYFTLMLFPSIETVIMGEIFNGLSIACYMGAYEAWIFEFKSQKENSFSLISRSTEMLLLGSIFASIVGAFYFDQAIYFALFFVFCALPFYLFTQQRKETKPLQQTFLGEIRFFYQTLNLKAVFCLFFVGGMQLIYQLWSVFVVQDLQINKAMLGYILATMFAGQWLLMLIARKTAFSQKTYANYLMLGVVSLLAVSVLLLSYAQQSSLFIIFCFVCFTACCGLTSNLYFSASCQLFAKIPNESSMISLLDMHIRLVGAVILGLYSQFYAQDTIIIWEFFPLLILIYCMFRLFLMRKSS